MYSTENILIKCHMYSSHIDMHLICQLYLKGPYVCSVSLLPNHICKNSLNVRVATFLRSTLNYAYRFILALRQNLLIPISVFKEYILLVGSLSNYFLILPRKLTQGYFKYHRISPRSASFPKQRHHLLQSFGLCLHFVSRLSFCRDCFHMD